MGRVLVIDAGTSGVRAAIVDETGAVAAVRDVELLSESPEPELVEFDPVALAEASKQLGAEVLAAGGRVDAVGITNHRCSTVVWERATGRPVGPGIGWQDRRTVDRCGSLGAEGFFVTPNATAPKAEWLARHSGLSPDALCVGTVDSWIAWTLSGGDLHVTDVTNASTGGVWNPATEAWNEPLIRACGLTVECFPEVVASSGVVGAARALPGSPPLAGLAGDQQASLIGQGCTSPGATKITFGSGAMLDTCVGTVRPEFGFGPAGTISLAAWRGREETGWMLEGVMLSAGTNIVWLRDALGLVDALDEVEPLAAACDDTGGVVFVPALHGLGAPYWDFTARGSFSGLTQSTQRKHLIRAVLEGIAQRAADLVDAAERDGGVDIGTIGVDGGMTTNATFVQCVADATRRPVDVAAVRDATVLGAAFLAGAAVGVWPSWHRDDTPRAAPRRVEPRASASLHRDAWREACRRAGALTPKSS